MFIIDQVTNDGRTFSSPLFVAFSPGVGPPQISHAVGQSWRMDCAGSDLSRSGASIAVTSRNSCVHAQPRQSKSLTASVPDGREDLESSAAFAGYGSGGIVCGGCALTEQELYPDTISGDAMHSDLYGWRPRGPKRSFEGHDGGGADVAMGASKVLVETNALSTSQLSRVYGNIRSRM